MKTLEVIDRINSEEDAMMYWTNEFGLPKYFSSFSELTDVEVKLAELQLESEKINREIQARDVNHMNEFTINRAIELHFLIVAGEKYFESCTIEAGLAEEEMESEFDRDFNDDSLFTRDYEED